MGEEIQCNSETKELIDAINSYNNEQEILKSMQMPHANIINTKTSNEMKNALLHILEEPNPTKLYWSQLNDLITRMLDNTLFNDAIKLIKQEDLSIYVRNKFKHVENTYYEKYYNYQMIKQMEQEYSEEQN